MTRFLNGLFRDRRGSMLVELGMAMPVLAMLILGGLEVGRYVLLHQKLDRVAGTVGDLVAQAETLSAAGLDGLFDAAAHVARPFDMAADGVVIVSSIGTNSGGSPVVKWQQSGGGGLAGTASRMGSAGGAATLPAGFTLDEGETVIVAEVFYSYAPWVLGEMTSPGEIYHRTLFRPRFSSLSTLD